MKKIFLLITYLLILTKARTQIKAEVKETAYTEIGLTAWTYHNKTKLDLVNRVDTFQINQTGVIYLETIPKKPIGVSSKGAYSFTILPERTLRRINIFNYAEDNEAIISVIKGKAQVQYNDSLYTVREGYTMTINKTAQVNENEYARADTTWMGNSITVEDEPLYVVINRIARYYGYNVTFVKKPQDHLMFSMDIPENVTGALNILKADHFNYKIQGNNITIY